MQRRKQNRTCDPELLKMVEHYLMSNSSKTYVDIEEMVEALQHKSYKYSRMKRNVFVEQVKDAYYTYCQQTKSYCEEDPQYLMTPTPGSGKSQPVVDINIIVSDISDSDIEIEEQEPPPPSMMSTQLNNLYKPKTNSNAPTPPLPKNSPKNSPKKLRNSNSTPPIAADPNSKPLSNTPLGEAISPPQVGDILEKDDGEDDLEIIADKNMERPLVPKVLTLKPIIKNLAPRKTEAQNGDGLTVSGNLPTGVKPNPFKNLAETCANSPSANHYKRGLKRKTVGFANEASPPIDPPQESKKNKKDFVGVLESNTTFADFGGSDKVVEEICKLLMHLKHPEIYETLGVTPPRGFLLHGPPGCGKSLLANAIAGELKLPMLKMAATELISGISGESENNIRQLFDQAVGLAPCIIFIDEIDSITPKRETAQREMEKRIVAQLLTCIDDLANKEKGKLVLLIGATNRIESIDVALRRAGRFDREICLGIPDLKAREQIIRVLSKNLRVSPDFDPATLAKLTPGYVGADLQALLREAAVESVNNVLLKPTVLATIPVQSPSKNNKEEIEVDTENKMTNGDDTGGGKPKEPELIDVSEDVEVMEIDGEVAIVRDAKVDGEAKMDEVSPEGQTKIDEVKETGTDYSINKPEIVVSEALGKAEISLSEVDPIRWLKDLAPLTDAELNDLSIQMKDFERALKRVQPSSKREGFATVPDTTWDDIGALKEIRDELQVSILGPVKYFSSFQALGLNTPAGVLLCGPPGCGKTLLAKAVANEAGINFISVKGPELLNMYVGESERAVRQCFLRAKNSSPCVIFFDELDALCPRRSEGPESGSTSRVVNQLLTEMDGMESRQGVFVMAATNRPDIIDPAILRPGRLDKVLFVNLPSPDDRVDILRAITKSGSRPLLGEDVNLEAIGRGDKCSSYTGADLAALVREASIAAFRELVLEAPEACKDGDLKVYQRHFEAAFFKTKPSVSKKDQEKYEQMKEKYSSLS